ncbi:MAG: LysR family transcriptional regulator [Acidobacteria bacterium]|nr:LysR family transcriptional regulator [Acidobacteriota bacterium]
MENARLKVFRAVAKHLNFRMASEELFLTQPAITQQIKALEEEVGAPLFDRSKGRVALTQHGVVLLGYAEQLKRTVDEAVEALAAIGGAHGGELSIGASQTIAQYLLPRIVAGFLKEHPRVSMQIHSGNTDEMLDMLAEHKIQLALIEGPPLRADVKTTPFMEDEMVLIVPPRHPWAKKTIDLATFREAPLLTREHGSGSRRVVEQALRQAGVNLHTMHVAMTFDSTESLMSAVAAGLGVAFVSQLAAKNQLKLGTIALSRVSGLALSRTFMVACPAGPAPHGNAGAFHQFLTQAVLPR